LEAKRGFGMNLSVLEQGMDDAQIDEMLANARRATDFLKALAHEGRLLTLCHLASGEKSVTELENLLSIRQAAVSQQLARLRLEGLVRYRREGKVIYYSLADERVRRTIDLVHAMFCGEDKAGDARTRTAVQAAALLSNFDRYASPNSAETRAKLGDSSRAVSTSE
jgi:ArsR family transcriptional regulator